MINFLKKRLQYELPFADIRNEGLSPKVLKLLIDEEKAMKAQFAKKKPRICAVMIALYQHQGEWYLPMMLRPAYSRAHPGQISFPGGKREEQDKDLIDTARREMEEEVGVSVPRTQILGKLSKMYIPPSNSMVTPIVGFLKKKPNYTPDNIEVEEVLDVPLSVLKNPKSLTSKKVILANGEYLELPAYAANGRLIWGGTARMIMEVIRLLEEKEKGWQPSKAQLK